MSIVHLIRVGAFGQVGRFQTVDSVRFPRESRVVCRTVRGLELGEVLSHEELPSDSPTGSDRIDGDLLRGVTSEDELLRERLDRHKRRAIRACERLLRERSLDAALIDAELLFDGKSLFFYFIGDVDERVQMLTDELAETYEAKARIGQFANLLKKGCGPDCGTEAGGGCSTGGCSTGGCSTGGCATGGCSASSGAGRVTSGRGASGDSAQKGSAESSTFERNSSESNITERKVVSDDVSANDVTTGHSMAGNPAATPAAR